MLSGGFPSAVDLLHVSCNGSTLDSVASALAAPSLEVPGKGMVTGGYEMFKGQDESRRWHGSLE